MINNQLFSVLINCYKRYDNLSEVIKGWLKNPVDEVILLDCGNKALYLNELQQLVKNEPKFNIISMTKDLYKTRTDYSVSALTVGDYVVFADDDIVPREGFLNDLYKGYVKSKKKVAQKRNMSVFSTVLDPFVGVIGRKFISNVYKTQGTYCRSDKVTEPTRVGFVGVCYMVARKYAIFDTRLLPHRNVDDLFHCMEVFPEVSKFVVPSKNYKDLPEASNDTAMFHNKKYTQIRQDYYAKMYNKNKKMYKKLFGE